MSDIDMNRVGLLLHVCDLAGQWPNLNGLSQLAMYELEGMADEASVALAQKLADERKAADEEAAKARAEADAQAKKEEEAQQVAAEAESKRNAPKSFSDSVPIGGEETTTSDVTRRV